MNRIWERTYPYALGVVAAAIFWWPLQTPDVPPTAINLLTAIISVAGIAVGFLMSAEAILLSLDESRVIRQLRQVGHYDLLISYLNEAILFSFALATLSAIGLFVDFKQTCWPAPVVCLWMFVAAAAGCCYFRVIRIFSRILRSPR